MKAKALRHIDIPDLYGKYFGDGEILSCATPHLYPMTFSLEGLREMVEKEEGTVLHDNGWKVVIMEVNEVQDNHMD